MGPLTMAEANVEIGGTAGVHIFNKNNELGVWDVPDAPSIRNAPLFGLRIGVFFGHVVGVEGEALIAPSEARDTGFSVTSLTYRAHLVAQLRAKDPENVVIPFLFAGLGGWTIVNAKGDAFLGDKTREITEDTDATYYFGAGVKLRLGDRFGVRADARVMAVPSSENDTPPSEDTKKVTVDFEALASFYIELGRTKKERAPTPPPVDDDPDKDGIRGAADACPNEPEDMDGFQDDDGCPEPDNDADGVPDANDSCPNEPEDRDGFQDEDGCPDPDNDNDGIPDGSDRCPLEPEDKDGFQDDDGCPDPDNDNDGVLDANDKCPEQPETRNGYQDEDGCPDEIPEKVKKFTGAIQGINFRVNTAELSPVSFRTIDKAVAVLQEFPELKLEIQGHTDDQQIKKGGKFADNLELSKARAESVREYFIKKGVAADRLSATGYGDSQPVVDPAGLKGGKLTQARAKNRRVEFQLVSPLTTK